MQYAGVQPVEANMNTPVKNVVKKRIDDMGRQSVG